MNDTIDALESLMKSEGWRVLADTARKEWAERERTGRRNALNDTDDKRALDKLRQITAAQEAVEWVLSLPSEEIARLRRQELTESTLESVRTPLSVAMAGQSRRGRL
jgi:hypothetical protein